MRAYDCIRDCYNIMNIKFRAIKRRTSQSRYGRYGSYTIPTAMLSPRGSKINLKLLWKSMSPDPPTWLCATRRSSQGRSAPTLRPGVVRDLATPLRGELRTGTRVGRAKLLLCLEGILLSKVATRVKLFWYITTPLVKY